MKEREGMRSTWDRNEVKRRERSKKKGMKERGQEDREGRKEEQCLERE